MGVGEGSRDSDDGTAASDSGSSETPSEASEADSPLPHIAYRESDWSVDRGISEGGDLEPGDTVTFGKRISDEVPVDGEAVVLLEERQAGAERG